jgi:hypothetical protein
MKRAEEFPLLKTKLTAGTAFPFVKSRFDSSNWVAAGYAKTANAAARAW